MIAFDGRRMLLPATSKSCHSLRPRPLLPEDGETNQAFSLLAPYLNASPPLCPTQQLIGALTLHRSNRTKQALAWSPIRHRSLLIDAERELLSEIHRSKP